MPDREEVSILAIVDGRTIIPLEPAQDHKRAYDDDQGPNTGGMGAYTPASFATPELMATVIEKILIPTVHTMKKQGTEFRGILYAGIMRRRRGRRSWSTTSAWATRRLSRSDAAQDRSVRDPARSCGRPPEGLRRDRVGHADGRCVVMAAEGYPGNYPKGRSSAA